MVQKRYVPLLPTPRSSTNNFSPRPYPNRYPPLTNNSSTLALPSTSHNYPSSSRPAIPVVPRKQLTQKEYEEKRAKNLCFYSNQRYIVGHKCSGQLYVLEVLDEEIPLEVIQDDIDHDIEYYGPGINKK